MELFARKIGQPFMIAARIETTSVITAKSACVKTSAIKGAAVSIALSENRRCRTQCQRDCDNHTKPHVHFVWHRC